MKIRPIATFTVLFFAIIATSALRAHDDGHNHKEKAAGPNGGRLVTSVTPHVEILVTQDRRVQITFLDDRGNAIAPVAQTVEVTTGSRSAPVRLTFAKANTSLLSEQPVPQGDRLPMVVLIRDTPESKAIVERFTLDLAHCQGCNLAEYACTCTDH